VKVLVVLKDFEALRFKRHQKLEVKLNVGDVPKNKSKGKDTVPDFLDLGK
jgi:hypothetical protein